MNNLIRSISICLLALTGQAQTSPIMVCNTTGNTCAAFYNLDSAYVAANPGDYIYIPGGVYILNTTVNKEVHIIGAGNNADSSLVTGFTMINGDITLGLNASNSSFEGLHLTSFFSGPTTVGLSNITFSKCNVAKISMRLDNSFVKGCIIRTSSHNENNFYNGTYNTFLNSYIVALANLSSSNINHCQGLSYCNSVTMTTFKNTIFNHYPHSPAGQPGSNNSWNNNVYAINYTGSYAVGFINSSNNALLAVANLFSGSFSSSNLNLIATSPALTAGENGIPLGVFGGPFPYKAGAVPSNPHIYQKNISASTNANGELPVQISVRAEDY